MSRQRSQDTGSSPYKPETMIGRIPEILAYLVRVESWLALGGLAVVLSVLEWVGTIPGPLPTLALPASQLMWGVYFFLVARKASKGKPHLPSLADYRDVRDDLIKPLLRVLIATFWYWMAILALVQTSIGFSDYLARYVTYPLGFLLQQGPLGYALLAIGMIYLPMAVVAALTRHELLPMLDPSLGPRIVLRIPHAYATMFLILCVLGVIGFAMNAFGMILTAAMPIPLASPVIRFLLKLWIPLAQARLLGSFIDYNQRFFFAHVVKT